MAGWLAKIFNSGFGEVVGKVGDVVTKFSAGHLGKKEMNLELEKILHTESMAKMAMVSAEIGAKERIMVAELQQGDTFTKRARPSIIYTGLVAAVIDGIGYIDFTMPSDFWYVWGGVCGIYVLGRSTEKVKKNGIVGKVAGIVAGKTPSILRD